MSEPIKVAAQLVRGEWADETAEGESGALEKLTDLMREAGVMIRDQYDELARLRKNSDRWEWLAEFGFYKCSGGSLSLRLNASNREELVDAVDSAIAAEKGTE